VTYGADDWEENPPAPPPRRRRFKLPESSLGNALEAVFTYGVSFFIYLPINALLIFGPWEMNLSSPTFWTLWIGLSLAVDAGNRIAANIGIQEKFASKTMRLFADLLSSVSPLLIPLLMIILTLTGVYHASYADGVIAILMSWFCLNDVFGNSNIVHTALRRVNEVARDI